MSIDYLLNDNSENIITASFSDDELLRYFKAAQNLPEYDKKIVKELINAFLIKNKIKDLVNN